MRIGFIGAGRAGSSLGMYFVRCGLSVCGYYSLDPKDAKFAAKNTNSRSYDLPFSLILDADIIIISVPDDNIEDTALEVIKSAAPLGGKIFLHLSGVHSSKILENLKENGAYTASIHPAYTFTTPESVPDKLNFTAEGDQKALKPFLDAGLDITEISAEQKAAYHAAAVFVSNYLVALFAAGDKLLEAAGINSTAGELFANLSRAALENVINHGTKKALSGPIARGDLKTVSAHLKVMPNELLGLYQSLGDEIVGISDLDDETRKKMQNTIREMELKYENYNSHT